MIYSPASHQGAIEVFWFLFTGALVPSIFVYSQWLEVRRSLQVLTSDEVTKEVSFRKQPLDRGLLLVLRASMEKKHKQRVKKNNGYSVHRQGCQMHVKVGSVLSSSLLSNL